MSRISNRISTIGKRYFAMQSTSGKQSTEGFTEVYHEKKLFTPGPLGVSKRVRQAMLKDYGSRDTEFINTVKFIRNRLVEIAGVRNDDYTCIPMQGSGTYCVEAVFQTSTPKNNGKVLILANGAYGKRMKQICKTADFDHYLHLFPENERIDLKVADDLIKKDPYTNVAVVHCETSSGVVNPVEELGDLVKRRLPDASFFVDAMSSFGAIPVDLEKGKIDFIVSSANKCLEGVPGFSYAIVNKKYLKRCEGNARSMSLDLYDQYITLERTGQFRFTPPTHTMMAFKQALIEYEEEGGLAARCERYKLNNAILRKGMKNMGFREFIENDSGYIITSFYFPEDNNFDFHNFYIELSKLGQVIYPGKVLEADCFRIGNIGHLYPHDMTHLLNCIRDVCSNMNIKLPTK